jgi:cell division protein FtsI/penicillin-binding protein 2
MPRRDEPMTALRRLGAAARAGVPYEPRPPRARRGPSRRALLWTALTLAVLVAAAGGVLVARDLLRTNPPEPAVRAWLAAWQAGDTARMRSLLAEPVPDLADRYKQVNDSLGVTGTRLTPGEVTTEDGQGTATFRAELTLNGTGTWRYQGRLPLREVDDEWKVAWTPAAIHPELAEGTRLDRVREWPQRAPILDRAGRPLTQSVATVTVGLRPDKITDRQALLATLQRVLGDRMDVAEVTARLDDPSTRPDAFVPVAELPQPDYQKIRPVVHPLPGTVFAEDSGRASPPSALQPVVGVTREATAEDLKELGAPYQAGDRVGASGLERTYEQRLAGTPSWEIRLVEEDAGTGTGQIRKVLHREEGTAPEPVTTSIDPRIQAAAASALRGVGKHAALVALQASTGEVRAAVSAPDTGLNRAFSGHYAPGSTFKVVTATALLANGLAPADPVPCTATINVGGRNFKNFESGALGTVPFTQVFAHSCNTGFISAAQRLPDGALGQAAETYGFNLDYKVQPPAFTARFPQPESDTEAAAAAIGQGRVLASPLHMASVAAAVASGAWRPPAMVQGEPPAVEPRQLDPQLVGQLRSLMRAVVTEGSGTALRGIPGVAGKSGTAEFGQGDPLPTHAWFIGFRGDLAFAVLLEDGGVGGRDAAPVAARFLQAL